MFSTKLGAFSRLVTWPILVILGLNLENMASASGYDTFISGNKDTIWPVAMDVYNALTSLWIWYPTIFISGCIFYEWVSYFGDRMEKDGSSYQRNSLKRNAKAFAPALRHRGLIDDLRIRKDWKKR